MSPKILHIEPTDACNAACPQCARETDSTFNKKDIHHLTLDQIKKLVSDETISHLDKMFMCGNYGDPAAGKHTLDIYKYFQNINPKIVLGMNTNGGIKSADWWQSLASVLNQPQDYVVWSIDGLEDTNHIYRKNVDWSLVLRNAQAFINAGGNAHWEMLVFEHNKHQVEQAQELAKELGFKWFRAKVSRRFDLVPVSFLSPPSGWINPVVSQGTISCQRLEESSTYISATGKVYPCCYLGATDFTEDKFNQIVDSWSTETPNSTCAQVCAKNNNGTSFTNQWQREVELCN